MKKPAIIVPEGCKEVLLHACCAPCSSAIVEWMVQHDVRPTIFYYNPNIWPREEYEIRKNESKRHAESLGPSVALKENRKEEKDANAASRSD